MGGTWPQREGILSALVPPERLGAFLATSPDLIEQDMLDEMVEAMGERAADPQAVFFRRWGVDPWTEGYITQLAPRRRDGGRAAARHARAALLRLRLGPVGLRLHGGRGADRAGRGARAARTTAEMAFEFEHVTAAPVSPLATEHLVRMRDGARLATDVYLPEGLDGVTETVLVRLPYDKCGDYCFMPRLAPLFTAQRYAFVVQDVRGKFRSEGDDIPFVNEVLDGYDTLDWIVGQPWSNGRVGMFGDSYYGYTQWACVASGHPALRAICPRCTGADVVDLPRPGSDEVPLMLMAAYLAEHWVGPRRLRLRDRLDAAAAARRVRADLGGARRALTRVRPLLSTPGPAAALPDRPPLRRPPGADPPDRWAGSTTSRPGSGTTTSGWPSAPTGRASSTSTSTRSTTRSTTSPTRRSRRPPTTTSTRRRSTRCCRATSPPRSSSSTSSCARAAPRDSLPEGALAPGPRRLEERRGAGRPRARSSGRSTSARMARLPSTPPDAARGQLDTRSRQPRALEGRQPVRLSPAVPGRARVRGARRRAGLLRCPGRASSSSSRARSS